MTKRLDIEYRINQLDGGTFQRLCDAYLQLLGYGQRYSLGMEAGTNKTAPGSPDTYFVRNGKYVLAMYTTEKSNTFKKVMKDLEKCFDSKKTGLQDEDIIEIVYCYTCTRFNPGMDKQLHNLCKEHDIELNLIGLNKLADDLYSRYQQLAREYLSINPDTGQINSINEFIRIHDYNETVSPLKTKFSFRQDDLRKAKELLAEKKALVITGKAGVGKTRFALKMCEDYSRENDFEVLCIKSNNLDLSDDLTSAVSYGRKYLIFVDDANELEQLSLVLNFLNREFGKDLYRFIFTVRDYAKKDVLNKISEVTKPNIIKLEKFEDKEIRALIKDNFGITNSLYSDQIVSIANGNARLAMLAGKLTKENGNLEAIRNVTDLYEYYYEKQINKIINNYEMLASAGIIAFFQALRLDNLEPYHSILEAMNITEKVFIACMKTFSELELVDLCLDKAVKIADQSFGNYLIKYVFVDEKIIPLSKMLNISFFINKNKTIEACNVILQLFADEKIEKYIIEQIGIVWDKLEDNEELFWPFFKSVFTIRPVKSLCIIKDKIDLQKKIEFDVSSIEFKKEESSEYISDDIISILCGFKSLEEFPEAAELLLIYYRKRPDLFKQIYGAFVNELGIDKNSAMGKYGKQKTVVDKLCDELDKNDSENYQLLFIRIAEQYLQFKYTGYESDRKFISLYHFALVSYPELLEYRLKLLDRISELYVNEKLRKEIDSFLYDYGRKIGTDYDFRFESTNSKKNYEATEIENDDFKIVQAESKQIILLVKKLSVDNLYHCLIAEHIRKTFDMAGCKYDDSFECFLDTRKYKVYKKLKCNRNHRIDEEYQKQYKDEIENYSQNFTLSDFQFCLQVCKEAQRIGNPYSELLSRGLEYIIDSLSRKKELYIEVVNVYLDDDTPYNINPCKILPVLFQMVSPENVKKIIESHEFAQKNNWAWSFYVFFPENMITERWAIGLLDFLNVVPDNLKSSGDRNLFSIGKYKKVDKKIIIKASRIIMSHYDQDPFLAGLYFSSMFETMFTDTSEVIDEYRNDMTLLEEIYIKCAFNSSDLDYNGKFLSILVEHNKVVMSVYLDQIKNQGVCYYDSFNINVQRLKFIWKKDSYISDMDDITEYLFGNCKKSHYVYTSIITFLLQNNDNYIERTREWITHNIERYYEDKDRMYLLFDAIQEFDEDTRRMALAKFLQLNNDFELFEILPLQETFSSYSWNTEADIKKAKIYLESLKSILSGSDLIKHKNKVEGDIDKLNALLEESEIDDLLDS